MERDSRRASGFDQQEISQSVWQPTLALLKHISLSLSRRLFLLFSVLGFALHSQTYSSIHPHLQSIKPFLPPAFVLCLSRSWKNSSAPAEICGEAQSVSRIKERTAVVQPNQPNPTSTARNLRTVLILVVI